MTEIILPGQVQFVLSRLKDYGHEGYAVGGCVRDLLMGRTPSDYDVTTDATPGETKKCFEGFRVVETGLKYGTVTVIIDGASVEITTYRIEGVYEDNRHPKGVSFSRRLEDDLSRRDFTINAMAFNPDKGLIDLFSGREDIRKKLIRCVGDPDKRFGEDGLRILRALRFASALGFFLENETAQSIHRNRELISNISYERIYCEFTRLLCGVSAAELLNDYSDIICVFIPELKSLIGFQQNSRYHCYDVYTHTLMALEASPADLIIRLAVFFHDFGKPECYTENRTGGHFYGHPAVSARIAETVLNRLRADKNTIRRVKDLIYFHDEEISASEKYVRHLLNRLSLDDARMLMEVKRADSAAHAPRYRDKIALVDEISAMIDREAAQNGRISLSTLAIDGNDLIFLGMKPGKEIGETLKLLLRSVLDGELKNEKETLIGEAEKIKAKIKS